MAGGLVGGGGLSQSRVRTPGTGCHTPAKTDSHIEGQLSVPNQSNVHVFGQNTCKKNTHTQAHKLDIQLKL